MEFTDREAHRAWLASQAALPQGFSCGKHTFEFTPFEVEKRARMTLTVIRCDEPTESFGALFTRNAFPGAPVLVGRSRLASERLGAIVVNNKISNVCAPNGVENSERIAASVAELLGLRADEVLPSSTGVIGWRLPVDSIVAAIPAAVGDLQADSVLPAAEGIVTTDLYPKVRRVDLEGGSIVGIAKGAGMIEPNLATMLVYVLTDLDVEREELREALGLACDETFNCMSVDSDTSTSDTVVALSSRRGAKPDAAEFRAALTELCTRLAEDVARNGEGVHHVQRVTVTGAPSDAVARALGKSVVNSPLWQCALCGNDPNVGRLICALGKEAGRLGVALEARRISIQGVPVFEDGVFVLDPAKENELAAALRDAEMYASAAPDANGVFAPPIDYPPHERRVEIEVELGAGTGGAVVIGTDRTHEYISENADYRS